MTPKAPDPYQTASAQSGADRDAIITSAMVNNYNESSPFGSVSYTRGDDGSYVDSQGKTISVPSFNRSMELSPDQQALLDRQTQAGLNLGDLAVSQSDRLNTAMSEPFNPSLPDRGVIDPASWSGDKVQQALTDRQQPYLDRARSQMETKLINQGITPGSEAWLNQMQEMDARRNDAELAAILAGGQEQSRQADLGMQTAGYQTGDRGAALQEAMALRNQPINEIAALLNGGQVTIPQFSAPYQQGAPAPDVAGMVQTDYERQLAQRNAMLSGLFGLGSAAIGAF